MKVILSGDIGGTNARLQLNSYNSNNLQKIFYKKYLTCQFASFLDIIKKFLNDSLPFDKETVSFVCIAVAGPVKEESIKLTNFTLRFDKEEICSFFKLQDSCVKFINDFDAVGYGLNLVSESDIVTLQGKKAKDNSPILFLGAGTGFGVSTLINKHKKKFIFTSEAGHQNFSPVDLEQIQLLNYLKKKFTRVSIERLCSGPGLVNIYEYMCFTFDKEKYFNFFDLCSNKFKRSESIVDLALKKNDPLSLKTLDIFIRIYGSIAGDMALTFLPRGGLYIVGGIASRLVLQLSDGRFLNSFNDKGRMSTLMKEFFISVVTDSDIGIKGATYYGLLTAQNSLFSKA